VHPAELQLQRTQHNKRFKNQLQLITLARVCGMQVMFMITDCEACHALTPDLQKVAANLKVQQQLLAGLQDITQCYVLCCTI
jgi:hypothetical protein